MSVLVHLDRWEFGGDASLAGWVSRQPWDVLEIRGTRVRCDPTRQLVVDRLRNLAGRHSPDPVEVRSLQPGVGDGFDALCKDLFPTQRPANWRKKLSEMLATSPLLVVLDDGCIAIDGMLDRAATLVNRVQGVHEHPRFSVVAVGRGDSPDAVPVFDFRFGLPGAGALLAANEAVKQWEAYVELRVAWESGGDPSLCGQMLNQMDNAERRNRNDAAFDAFLDRVAAQCWSRGGEELEQVALGFHTWMVEPVSPGLEREQRAWQQSAEQLGAIWVPPGATTWRPSPWASRARLATPGLTDGERRLHRAACTCLPLLGALFTRALEFEVWLRALLVSRAPPLDANAAKSADLARARERKAEFDRRHLVGAARYYPARSLLRPSGDEEHMTLGELANVYGLARDPTQEDPLDRLVWVRNAVAHGHPVGWKAVLDLATAVAELRNRYQS